MASSVCSRSIHDTLHPQLALDKGIMKSLPCVWYKCSVKSHLQSFSQLQRETETSAQDSAATLHCCRSTSSLEKAANMSKNISSATPQHSWWWSSACRFCTHRELLSSTAGSLVQPSLFPLSFPLSSSLSPVSCRNIWRVSPSSYLILYGNFCPQHVVCVPFLGECESILFELVFGL